MKKLHSLQNNIFENSKQQANKCSNINKNLDSPIKVRKKNFKLKKIKPSESSKLFRTTTYFYKKNSKKKSIDINIFIKNNLIKYNSYPDYFYRKISNQILFNIPHHLVCCFKDNLIWNENYDYFKNFYFLKKSIELIPKIGNYYQMYTLFIPIYYPLIEIKYILSKYIKNKLKYLEMTEGEDDVKEDLKELDKNVLEGESNNENIDINLNINNEKNKSKVNESSKENNEKIINSTEIKTENNQSLSNYFGIDSIIKSKETSKYSTNLEIDKSDIQNNNFLPLDKGNNKNDNNTSNKVDSDFSLELASIIESFEKKKKRNIKINNSKNSNKCNTKKSKGLKMIKRISDKFNKTESNALNPKSNDSLKLSKNTRNNSLSSNYNLNNIKYKDSSNYKEDFSYRKMCMSNILKNFKLNKYKLLLKNKTKDLSKEISIFLKKKNFNISNTNDDKNITKNNENKAYKSIIFSRNNKKSMNSYIQNKEKRPVSTKEKNKKNLYINSTNNKKIRNFSKESEKYKPYKNYSYRFSENKINFKKKSSEKKNLSTNVKHRYKSIKAKEYNIVYTTPSIKMENNLNFKNCEKKNNKVNSLKQNKSNYINKNLFSASSQKIIFVKKRIENNNYSMQDNQTENLMNIINSSSKTLNSSNKIVVNKVEHIKKNNKKINKKEKKLRTTKRKGHFNAYSKYSLQLNNSLNNYQNLYETKYNNFTHKNLLRKMLFNKLKNKNLLKKTANKISPFKNDISSKNYINSFSSRQTTNSRINSNSKSKSKSNNKVMEPKLFFKKKKTFLNKRTLTDFNILKKKFNINESSSKLEKSNNNKNLSKVSTFSLIDNNHILKNKNNLIKGNNDNKIRTNKFNKKIQEISCYNSNNNTNLKKNFIKKPNFSLNVNAINNLRFNIENLTDKIKISPKKNLNNNSNMPYINKFKIHNLLKKNKMLDKNSKTKTDILILNNKNLINHYNHYSIDLSVKKSEEK